MNKSIKKILIFGAAVLVALISVLGWQPIKAASQTIINRLRFTDGLVAYWSFDGADVSGTTAVSHGSGSNNGVLTSGPKPEAGAVGQALRFNGTSSYVNVTDPGDGSLDMSTSDFTLSAWIRTTSATAAERIINKRNSSNVGYEMYISTSVNSAGFLIGDAGGISFGDFGGGTNLRDGQWHNVVVVANRAGTAVYYVDGATEGTPITISSRSGTVDNAQDFIIGRYGSSAVNYFDGSIDEVRVYNRALSASEVAYQYNRTAAATRSTIGTTQAHKFDSGTVVNHSYDSSTVTSSAIIDQSTSGLNGVRRNGALVGPGIIGQALYLDGSNDYDEVTYNSALEYTGGDMSISFWVYMNSDEAGGYFFSKPWNGSGEYNYYVRYTGSTLFFFLSGATSGSITGTTSLVKNQWNHIVATVDSSKNMNLYLNGKLDKSGSHAISDWTPPSGNLHLPLAIGTLYPYGAGMADQPTFSISGRMDEARLYNRALGASEVADMYQAGATEHRSTISSVTKDKFDSGLVMHLGFNGGEVSGSTVTDKSGNGNNGTITTLNSSIKLKPGVIGQGVDFVNFAASPNVSVTSSASINFDTGSFTAEMWGNYRDYTYPKSGFMIKKSVQCYVAGASNGGWDIGQGYDPNGITICYSDGVNLATNGSVVFDSGYKPTDLIGNWALLDAVFDKSANRVKFYVNGVKQTNEYDISTVTGTINSSAALTIGFEYGWQTDGSIDEVKLYNRALTAAEIAEHYKAARKN